MKIYSKIISFSTFNITLKKRPNNTESGIVKIDTLIIETMYIRRKFNGLKNMDIILKAYKTLIFLCSTIDLGTNI